MIVEWLTPLFGARFADAVKLQGMLSYLRKVFGTTEHGALYPSDPAMMYILDLAAIEADDMVMLGDIGKFIMGMIVAQIDRLDHPFLFQRFQRSVDGGLVDATGERIDDILRAYRILIFFKDLENGDSGRRRLITAFS